MWIADYIDEDVCDYVLARFHDTALLNAARAESKRELLLDSHYLDGRQADSDLSSEHIFDLLSNCVGHQHIGTADDYYNFPVMLLDGSIRYEFKRRNPPPPIIKKAPYHWFYQHNSHGPHTGFPDINIAAGSFCIILNPILFHKTMVHNPAIFSTFLSDYNQLVASLFKWLPLPVMPLKGYRAALFLRTMLPNEFEREETVQITQREIASRMNISRATVAQDIAHLSDSKIIVTGHGNITVDTDALIDFIGAH